MKRSGSRKSRYCNPTSYRGLRLSQITDTCTNTECVKTRLAPTCGVNRSFIRRRQRPVSRILLEMAERHVALPSGKHPVWSISVNSGRTQAVKPYPTARYVQSSHRNLERIPKRRMVGRFHRVVCRLFGDVARQSH